MTIGTLFWIVFIVALVLHVWSSWPLGRASTGLVVWIMLFLLGWQVFGFPIQDSGPGPRDHSRTYNTR